MKTVRKLALSANLAAIGIVAVSVLPNQALGQEKATPVLVRNVDEPGLNRFQVHEPVSISGTNVTAALAVPAGKVAVIEHVSAMGMLQAKGGIVQSWVSCGDGAHFTIHALVLTPQGTNSKGETWYAASQPIKCYATDHVYVTVQAEAVQAIGYTWSFGASGYVLNQ